MPILNLQQCVYYIHNMLKGRDHSSLSCIWIHTVPGCFILWGSGWNRAHISSCALGANSHDGQRFPNPDQFLSIIPQPTAHFHFEDQNASQIQHAQIETHHSLRIRFSMKSPISPISILLSETWNSSGIPVLSCNPSTHQPQILQIPI